MNIWHPLSLLLTRDQQWWSEDCLSGSTIKTSHGTWGWSQCAFCGRLHLLNASGRHSVWLAVCVLTLCLRGEVIFHMCSSASHRYTPTELWHSLEEWLGERPDLFGKTNQGDATQQQLSGRQNTLSQKKCSLNVIFFCVDKLGDSIPKLLVNKVIQSKRSNIKGPICSISKESTGTKWNKNRIYFFAR